MKSGATYLCPTKEIFIRTAEFLKPFVCPMVDSFLDGSYWKPYKQNTYITIRGRDNSLHIVYGNTKSNIFLDTRFFGYEYGDYLATIQMDIFQDDSIFNFE